MSSREKLGTRGIFLKGKQMLVSILTGIAVYALLILTD